MDRSYVWCDSWVNPFESPYSLLLKFAWANAIRTSGVVSLLAGKIIPTKAWPRPTRSLLRYDWMNVDTALFPMPNGMRLAFDLSESLASALPLFDDRAIRYCPLCLSQSYHTLFFQMAGLQRCPIHGCLLLTSCSQCACSTLPYELKNGALDHPFLCHDCHQPLSGTFSQRTFRATRYQKELRSKRLGPWIDWCQTLNKHVRFSFGPTTLSYLPVTREQYGARAHSYLKYAVAQSFFPSPQSSTIFELESDFRLQEVQGAYKEAPRRWLFSRLIEQLIRRKCGQRSVVKSIRRYLLRRYLKQHRRCIGCAFEVLNIHKYYFHCWIGFSDELCPLAQAYVRWFLWYRHLGYFHGKWGATFSSQEHNKMDFVTRDWESSIHYAWPFLLHFHTEAALMSALLDHANACATQCPTCDAKRHHTLACRERKNTLRQMIESSCVMDSFPEIRIRRNGDQSERRYLLGLNTSFALELERMIPKSCLELSRKAVNRRRNSLKEALERIAIRHTRSPYKEDTKNCSSER